MAINVSSKKPKSANTKSHALNRTKRQQKLNLQVVRCEDGTKVRITAREKKALLKSEKVAA